MARYKLDEVDHQILDLLIDNARIPFTDVSKQLDISAGTVHVRVRKMEEVGIITGSTLTVDYDRLGYTFIAYVGIFLERNNQAQHVLERLEEVPFVTEAHITSGQYNIFVKIRARNIQHAKEVIYMIDEIEGVSRSETMISMEEVMNDNRRLLHKAFREM
ncbi:Lrp/AsnC ligand binding domain-containing protein [Capnocytophaga sp. oral taxon 878]|uniref:Lrp/AsnC ligand binding domain-containing protein n=1 Tax=Capnocytophaga sp. oral taxon 878 TaxID=1316596 RepID=UPI000D031EF3|nr:Lrp/AsnC ligand binding domain-containing protein [Capnocytophaga sp. oral taxon 878]AVM49676.1 transcriptional regulator [Capnocytophaga sp. oral taxon 878]